MRLPAEYATTDLDLGYAQTSHATQGRTVDTALLLVDTPTDHAGVYTPMTRGREANHAYVVVEANQTPTDLLSHAITREWVDEPAIARQDQIRLAESRSSDRDVEFDELVRQSIARAQARRTRSRSNSLELGL